MKTRYFKWVFASVTILSMLTACSKDWLEEKSNKNQATPGSLNDYQAILNDVSNLNAICSALGEVASDGHYVSEAVWTAATAPAGKSTYTWTYTAQDGSYKAAWSNTYDRAYRANFVLDKLKEFKGTNDSEDLQKNQIRGQALFIKALAYYWQAQLYAQPYDPTTAAIDQGIVIQENSDFTKSVKIASVEKTYELILEYLNEAILYLPKTPKVATQASLPAAHALLARTYMAMLDYEKAWIYADKAMSLNSNLMDYNHLSLTANFIGIFNQEVLFHDVLYASELGGVITSGCLVDQSLYDSYDNNDLRKTVFFRKTGTNITFKGTYNNSATQLFCGIATDEVYLMRAECYARRGNTTAAMKDLNDLLKTRWNKNVSYIDEIALDATDALGKILVERKKELILRGLRWGDLRRLNKEARFKVTLTRTIGGQTYTLEPNSYKYTFPIPKHVIDISGVHQTPGW